MEKNLKTIIKYIFNYGLNPLILIFTTPMITKLVSPKEYGLYNYYQVLIGIIVVFLFSWIPAIITRYLNKEFKEYYNNKNTVIIILRSIVLIYMTLILAIYFIFREVLLLLLLINQLLLFLSDLTLIFYQTNGKIKKYTIINIIKNLTYLFIIIIAFYYRITSVYVLFIGNLLFNTVYLLVILLKNKIEVRAKYNKKILKEMLMFSLPLIGINLAALILNAGDRMMMKYILKNSEYYIGIYSMNYNIYSKLIMIILSSILAIIPSTLYITFEKKGEKFYINELKKIIELYLYLTFVLNIIVYFNFNNLNFLLLNEKYFIENNLPVLILNAYIYYGLYSLLGNYLAVTKQLKYINYFIIFSGILNIILNILYLKKYGYTFCAVSTLVCFFINYILLELFFRIKLKIKILNRKLLILSFFNLIIVFFSYKTIPPIVSLNKIDVIIYLGRWGLIVVAVGIISYFIVKKNRRIL